MRLAVVSDIHGNLPALEAVIADIGRRGVDAVVNLGDILSGPLQPAETAERLMALAWPTIAGNHERQLLSAFDGPRERLRPGRSDDWAATKIIAKHADFLRGLPRIRDMDGEIRLIHGRPDTDLEYLLETVTPDWGVHGASGLRAASDTEVRERLATGPGVGAARLVLCGHSHVPRLVCCGGITVVNPGSVGLQAYDDTHPHRHVVENLSPHARYAIVERSPRGWQAQLLAVAYDWEAQARLAAQRGFMDWAHALVTGRARVPDGWRH